MVLDVRFAARPRVMSENNRITPRKVGVRWYKETQIETIVPKTPRRMVVNIFAMTSTAGGEFEK
jgi:hypothetical protein